ncbi:MAG TPA: SDR family oxidoreductase [Gemmatimonadaceae bacterium]
MSESANDTPRTALVTGASRGIGLAIARALVGRDTRVVLVARTEPALREAATALGDRAIPIACDVGNPDALDALVARATSELGGVPDVLVNNAGLFKLAPIDITSGDDFAAAVDTNLVAPFRLIRAFLPSLRARKRGHIVSIGSIADRVAFSENGAYAASKFGLRGLHEVLRAELMNSGVRSTLISPSAVDTPLWDEVDPDNRPGFLPRASMLRPDAVAAAVIYVVTQPADVNVSELRLSRA